MRKTKSKQIRAAIGYDRKNPNPILKRLYKRAKKDYNKLSVTEKSKYEFNYE